VGSSEALVCRHSLFHVLPLTDARAWPGPKPPRSVCPSVVTVSLEGDVMAKCQVCNGSGKCRDCDGRGSIGLMRNTCSLCKGKQVCWKCNGKGS